MSSQIEPETVSFGTSTNVVSPDIVGVGDPETSGGLIGVQERFRGSGVDDEVVFDDVVGFNTIFNEDSVSLNPVSNVLLDSQEVDTVDSDGSVVGVMDGVTNNKRLNDVTDQMVMDGISTQIVSLTGLSNFSVRDSGNGGIITWGEGHDVATVFVGFGARITLNDDVSGDHGNLSSHFNVDSTEGLFTSVMAILEGRVNSDSNFVTSDGSDSSDLLLFRLEVVVFR